MFLGTARTSDQVEDGGHGPSVFGRQPRTIDAGDRLMGARGRRGRTRRRHSNKVKTLAFLGLGDVWGNVRVYKRLKRRSPPL